VGKNYLLQTFTASKMDKSLNFTGSKWDEANYSKTEQNLSVTNKIIPKLCRIVGV